VSPAEKAAMLVINLGTFNDWQPWQIHHQLREEIPPSKEDTTAAETVGFE